MSILRRILTPYGQAQSFFNILLSVQHALPGPAPTDFCCLAIASMPVLRRIGFLFAGTELVDQPVVFQRAAAFFLIFKGVVHFGTS
jgi:hypothetical protein